MTRLHTLAYDQVDQETSELFATIKRSIGKLPNVYATIGSNSPAVLAHVLGTGATLAKSSLNKREQEAINLAVSEATGCDYCVAAHTMTGKMAGYTVEQTRELRSGSFAEDARIDALVKFALHLVQQRVMLGQLERAAEHVELAAWRLAGHLDDATERATHFGKRQRGAIGMAHGVRRAARKQHQVAGHEWAPLAPHLQHALAGQHHVIGHPARRGLLTGHRPRTGEAAQQVHPPAQTHRCHQRAETVHRPP